MATRSPFHDMAVVHTSGAYTIQNANHDQYQVREGLLLIGLFRYGAPFEPVSGEAFRNAILFVRALELADDGAPIGEGLFEDRS